MIAAALSVLGMTRTTPAAPVAVAPPNTQIGELEEAAARAPQDVGAAHALADAYVRVGQPGLALAVLNRAPERQPSLLDARARALASLGQLGPALTVQLRVLVMCEQSGCPRSLVVPARRRAQWLNALVDDGVEDGPLDPVRAHAAYRRVTRQVRLASR